MPSQLHEVLVAMVRESEAMTRSIAEWATGEPMPADFRQRLLDSDIDGLDVLAVRAVSIETVDQLFDR